MRTVFLCITIFVLSINTTFASSPVEPYTHYDIDVYLDVNEHALIGKQEVTYTNKSNRTLNEIYFVLAANHSSEKNPYIHDIENDRPFWNGWQAKSTKITFVNDVNNETLEYILEKAPPLFQNYSLNNVLLKIILPQPLATAETIKLIMGFNTTFPESKMGDEAHWQGIYRWRFAWNPVELPIKNDTWYTDGFKMLPANYDVKLRVPEKFDVAAGADEKFEPTTLDQIKTYEFRTKVPQVSVPITMGPNLNKVTGTLDNIKIESYYLDDHKKVALMMENLSEEIIAYYQPKYGEYRYDNLVIAETSAPFTAMASDGLIFMAETFYRHKDLMVSGLLNRLLEFVLAHEIGHLWWGIPTSPDFAHENWLSEAFANYLAYSYMEDKYGSEKNLFEYDRPGIAMPILRFFIGDHSLRQMSESAYLNVYHLGWDEEISKDPREREFGNVLGPITYEKGYWVLRALENEIGRSKLTEALYQTFTQFQGKTLSIKEFQKVCEEVSNQSLDWFFKQWIYSKAYLDYSIDNVEITKQENEFIAQVTVNKTGDAVANSLIIAETEDGQRLTHKVSKNEKNHIFEFKSDSELIKVEVDPYQKIPDIYRINNTWPRQIKSHFGLFDDPLDAYSIRYLIFPSSVYVPAKGTASGGLVLGVSGGYSPTHQWTVASSAGFAKDKTYLSTIAAFNYRFNAKESFISSFNATGHDTANLQDGVYIAEIGHQHTLYETPNLGFTSKILLPSNVFQNKLVLMNYDGWYQHADYQQYAKEHKGALALWRFSYILDESLRFAWTNKFNFDLSPPGVNDNGYYKIQLNSTKKFRIIPNWIFQISALTGYSSENTITPEKFDFKNTKSYFGEHFRRTTANIYADLEFPLIRELDSSIFNLFSFKSIYANLFTNASAIGSNFVNNKATQAVESGAQLKFVFTTLGGFANFNINAGWVTPWHKRNTEKNPDSTIFIGLGLNAPL